MSSSDLRLRAEKAEVELEAQIEAGFIVCQAKLREIDALEARIAEQSQEIKRLLAYVDGNDKDVEIGNLEARVKELEELMQEAVFDDWFCQNEPDFMERWNKALAEKEKK